MSIATDYAGPKPAVAITEPNVTTAHLLGMFRHQLVQEGLTDDMAEQITFSWARSLSSRDTLWVGVQA